MEGKTDGVAREEVIQKEVIRSALQLFSAWTQQRKEVYVGGAEKYRSIKSEQDTVLEIAEDRTARY